MKNSVIYILFLFFQSLILAQQNCKLLKEDSVCYKACLLINQASAHRQGSYSYQKHLTDAIDLCPTLSYAYFEKSVAFLKRGMFVEWKDLMDKAVALNPKEHLSYRGWCQFAFLHNYEETIKDLNELTRLMGTSFIGYGQNGDYDLRIVLALSYRFIGQQNKAIGIIENVMEEERYEEYKGLFDYLHLGVLYLETDQPEKALQSFENQIKENELAEVYFYIGKAYLMMQNKEHAKSNFEKSLEFYNKGTVIHRKYYEISDQIYKQDILNALKTLN